MKKILTISLLLLMAASATFAAGNPIREKKAKAAVQTVCFESDIDCENCVKKVQANIAYVKGVKKLDVSLKDHTITVGYDPAKTSEETLAGEIRKLGYTADKRPAEAKK